jgi:uncharacterized protein (DUF1810 family)
MSICTRTSVEKACWNAPYASNETEYRSVTSDIFDLTRFVNAQAPVYETALAEIRSGRKRSHWMWFIFPQLAGLGSSDTARHFAIRSREEAEAYLRHAVLGPRLLTCANATLDVEGRSAHDIFGNPDDMKLRSSATLFAAVSEPDSVFHRLIARYFGAPDERTLELLSHP